MISAWLGGRLAEPPGLGLGLEDGLQALAGFGGGAWDKGIVNGASMIVKVGVLRVCVGLVYCVFQRSFCNVVIKCWLRSVLRQSAFVRAVNFPTAFNEPKFGSKMSPEGLQTGQPCQFGVQI